MLRQLTRSTSILFKVGRLKASLFGPSAPGPLAWTILKSSAYEELFSERTAVPLIKRRFGWPCSNDRRVRPINLPRRRVRLLVPGGCRTLSSSRTAAKLDNWYVNYADSLSDQESGQVIEFEFIGGGHGTSSPHEALVPLPAPTSPPTLTAAVAPDCLRRSFDHDQPHTGIARA